ncbi:hypothetical protein MANI_029283 [Metarhizium anisopliae]|nr:hypothetical protein MANI_029283 [Metarhizium anisopliae]
MRPSNYLLCALSLVYPLAAAKDYTCTINTHGLASEVDCREEADTTSNVVKEFYESNPVEVVCKKTVDTGSWTAVYYRAVEDCYFGYGWTAGCDPNKIPECSG